MAEALLIAGVRTPIGRYGGALAPVRPDDLAALTIRALTAKLPTVDWAAVDDVILGCANQAGEDNRNVARMAALLGGLPEHVSGTTINRLCGSGLDAVATAARLIRTGEADLVIAGGVESMSRAPFVQPKAETAYARPPGECFRGFAHDQGRPAHALHPAGEDELGLFGPDSARRGSYRVETAGAQAVDGSSGNGCRQAGEQHRHPRDVAVVLARLVRGTELHLVDDVGLERCPVDDRSDGGRGEVVGTHVRQRTAVAADRRAHRVADESFRH